MTYDLRSLQRLKHLCALGAFVLGFLHSFQVVAQPADVGYVSNGNGGGNWVRFGVGTKVTVLPGGIPTSYADPTPGSKGVEVRGQGSIPVGTAGRSVAVAVSGKVAVAKIASAAAGLLGGPVGLVLAVGSPYLLDWYMRSGVVASSDGPRGTLVPYSVNEEVTPANGCTLMNVVGESMYKPSTNQTYTIYPGGSNYDPHWLATHCTDSKWTSQQTAYQWPKLVVIVGNQAPPSVPLTEAQVASKLEATTPNPGVLRELYTIDKTGRYTDQELGDLAIRNTVVAGPTTVAGPVSTSTTPAQNGNPAKSTTTQTDYDCTYSTNKVLCGERKTTTETSTATNPTTGNPETTTTTTTQQQEAETPKTEEAKDPCLEHPNRNGCREDEFDVPTGEIPKTSKTITYAAENLGFAGGSCPANVTRTIHGMAAPITIVNWVDNCDKLTTYAKPMILALAMFSAMMIIFVGKPE